MKYQKKLDLMFDDAMKSINNYLKNKKIANIESKFEFDLLIDTQKNNFENIKDILDHAGLKNFSVLPFESPMSRSVITLVIKCMPGKCRELYDDLKNQFNECLGVAISPPRLIISHLENKTIKEKPKGTGHLDSTVDQ